MTLEQALIMHSVSPIITNCGNSYINAYTEEWLTMAKRAGAYHGEVIGVRQEVLDDWEYWLDCNGDLPDISDYQ